MKPSVKQALNQPERRMIALLLLIILSGMMSGCSTLKEAAKLTQYDLGKDAIPSITATVGEREVKGVETSKKDGIVSKQYTYVSTSVYDDLLAYVKKLMEEGWLVTKDIDLNVVPGSGELGTHSTEEGQILLVDFTYDDSGYTIKVIKGKGTLE